MINDLISRAFKKILGRETNNSIKMDPNSDKAIISIDLNAFLEIPNEEWIRFRDLYFSECYKNCKTPEQKKNFLRLRSEDLEIGFNKGKKNE